MTESAHSLDKLAKQKAVKITVKLILNTINFHRTLKKIKTTKTKRCVLLLIIARVLIFSYEICITVAHIAYSVNNLLKVKKKS